MLIAWLRATNTLPMLWQVRVSRVATRFSSFTDADAIDWERKGIEKGRVEGRLEALRAVLAARFGPPDEPVASRVAGIDSVDELRTLTRRALAAGSLQKAGVSFILKCRSLFSRSLTFIAAKILFW